MSFGNSWRYIHICRLQAWCRFFRWVFFPAHPSRCMNLSFGCEEFSFRTCFRELDRRAIQLSAFIRMKAYPVGRRDDWWNGLQQLIKGNRCVQCFLNCNAMFNTCFQRSTKDINLLVWLDDLGGWAEEQIVRAIHGSHTWSINTWTLAK